MRTATKITTSDVVREMRRLGLDACERDGMVIVAGWPDAMRYHPSIAVSVLAGLPNRSAITERGDAAMCAALEAAGAVMATK